MARTEDSRALMSVVSSRMLVSNKSPSYGHTTKDQCGNESVILTPGLDVERDERFGR